MNTESKGIYHWKLGDVALARVSQKTYARVRVVKDEKGLFYDDKVLGISGNEDGGITVTKELCYYVETCRTNHKFWLPYTSLHLAERSRPFYGNEKVSTKVEKTEVSPDKTSEMPRKNNTKEEEVQPLDEDVEEEEIDLNTLYDSEHMPENVKVEQDPEDCGNYETTYKSFVSRGKQILFDKYLAKLQQNPEQYRNELDYLNSDIPCTEDKYDLVIATFMTKKEVENYLHQCWRYNLIMNESEDDDDDESDSDDDGDEEDLEDGEMETKTPPIEEDERVTVHIPWCVVCVQTDRLTACSACPAAFHSYCKKEWLRTVVHRKNSLKCSPKSEVMVEKILSSTRTKIKVLRTKEEEVNVCPSCLWGPRVGFNDLVWNKLRNCSWWPARVLPPGEVPACLLARQHQPNDWPIRYYGTQNHSWGAPHRTCLFLPSHSAPPGDLQDALIAANEDYISVYLT